MAWVIDFFLRLIVLGVKGSLGDLAEGAAAFGALADAPMTASTREYMQKIGERKAGNRDQGERQDARQIDRAEHRLDGNLAEQEPDHRRRAAELSRELAQRQETTARLSEGGGVLLGLPAALVLVPWLVTITLVQSFAWRIAVLEDRRAIDAALRATGLADAFRAVISADE